MEEMEQAVIHGDVCWYSFARPDKRRPVLILTRTEAIPYLNDLVVSPITTTIRSIPSEVLLDTIDGLPEECVVNLDRIATIPKRSVGRTIAHLGPERMSEVRDALLFALQFEEY